MAWIITVLAIVLLAVIGWRYLSEQTGGMDKDRRELADQLLLLVRLMKNSGMLRAKAVEHGVTLLFTRVSGDDSSAVVSVAVEADLDQELAGRVDRVLAKVAHSSAFHSAASPTGNDFGGWQIVDIWEDACVAPIVYSAWRLLDALEIPQAARIDFSLDGPASGRWKRRLLSEG